MWFPWIHRHRIPRAWGAKAIASLHDLIFLQLPELFPGWGRRSEEETIGSWLASEATIVTSSHATVSALVRIFKCEPGRLNVIPLSGHHVREGESTRKPAPAVGGSGYLLCPANTTPHKNHEVLFAGVAAAGIQRPLVLTGGETDFWTSKGLRAMALRRRATEAGFTWGRSLFGLGYVDDATYFDLLDGACFRTELGPEMKVIGTGGLAEIVARETKAIQIIAPWLTLDGLRIVWEMNR